MSEIEGTRTADPKTKAASKTPEKEPIIEVLLRDGSEKQRQEHRLRKIREF